MYKRQGVQGIEVFHPMHTKKEMASLLKLATDRKLLVSAGLSLIHIYAVKTALMGPLAGLGDSLLNGTARPILASLAISLVHANLGWVGPIFFVIGMSIVSLGIRYLGVFQGYKQGIKLVEKINSSGLISKITDIAAIAAYTIVGGFIPALVVMNLSLIHISVRIFRAIFARIHRKMKVNLHLSDYKLHNI